MSISVQAFSVQMYVGFKLQKLVTISVKTILGCSNVAFEETTLLVSF